MKHNAFCNWPKSFLFPFVLTAIAAGCGAPATDARYEGEPLASLRGQLIADSYVPNLNGGSIQLALAWVPGISPGSNVPAALYTQNVTYSGQFPVGFTFPINSPPPPNARQKLSATQDGAYIHPNAPDAAIAVLIAYVDSNGNGTLDTIPTGGQPIDRILGVSIAPDSNQPDEAFVVIYRSPGDVPSDIQDPPPAGLSLFGAGANGLVQLDMNSDRLIRLNEDPKYNHLICEEYFSANPPAAPCGIPR